MYRAESELSKRETKKRLLVLIMQQIKRYTLKFLLEKKQTQKKCPPSDLLLIKPSGQIQVVRPEKPKQSKTSINPNIGLNLEPKG